MGQHDGDAPAMALIAGLFSTFCFTVQYIPQAWLNYKRKSISGLSTSGILMKLIGASFLGINALMTWEALPVVLYGFFNIAQHILFMVQFTLFTNKSVYIAFCFVPFIPYLLAIYLPATMLYTNLVKPLSQVVSHLPQMYVTYQKQSTEGISLATQHFNLLGGLAGMYMYSIIPPKSMWTYVVYANSLFQALSTYWMTVSYDGWDYLFKSMDVFYYFKMSKVKSVISLSTDHNTDKDTSANQDLDSKI
ncbi:hypothetical protein AKO1_007557 [Acrasis kona]|uniref:Uncharacterized protein n=1 Tax=Acrasis kona TaxID=1008807 RepID=A0AAW2YQU0_9EUKA